MIEVRDFQGKVALVNPSAIATVVEAGVSSKWHGISSVVKLFNGSVIESSESVQEIQEKLKEAYK